MLVEGEAEGHCQKRFVNLVLKVTTCMAFRLTATSNHCWISARKESVRESTLALQINKQTSLIKKGWLKLTRKVNRWYLGRHCKNTILIPLPPIHIIKCVSITTTNYQAISYLSFFISMETMTWDMLCVSFDILIDCKI